jgi:hypothetical protein
MTIFRVEKDRNYMVLNRTVLNDTRLSWKAKGIMAYLLSMPDDWKFYIEELVSHSTEGEKAFRTGFKELEKYGYVKRFPVREDGKITSWDTVVYETPLLGEKGDIQKDGLLSTDNKLSTEELSTENITVHPSQDSLKEKRLTSNNAIKLFQQLYRDKYNVNYTVSNYGREGKLIKDKVITPYPDLTAEIITIGVNKYEELFKTAKYPRPTIAMFSWAVNQIIAVVEQEKELTDTIAAIDEDEIEREMLERLARLK